MTIPYKPDREETVFVKLFRLLPQRGKTAALVTLATEVCEQLPAEFFVDLDDYDQSDVGADLKITGLLKQSIPWGSEVVQYVGDYWRDMLDRALGDASESWPQVLGGWEGSEEWLTDALMESISFYSMSYPGFEPDWGAELIQGFLDDWRTNFYDQLISLAKQSVSDTK